MSLTDDQLDHIRREPTYRCAIWTARLTAVPWLGGMVSGVVGLVSDTGPAEHLFVTFWLIGVALTTVAAALMHRAGVPFAREGMSWGIQDRRLGQTIYEDILGRPAR